MASAASNSSTSTLREQPSIANSEAWNGRLLPKRIVLFCDGTGQDGLADGSAKFTNVMRLARSVTFQDDRNDVSVPQIVLYEAGIGSDENFYSKYVDGAVAATLDDKIESGYGFIAQNYRPGDEIFLFGFSRGAYTARMIAALIGEIGILDRRDMDNFAEIFEAYRKLGSSKDPEEVTELKSKLSRWNDPESPGRRRADPDGDGFVIKCIGVFDTVGSVGLPEEVAIPHAINSALLGVPDKTLGKHVERAYHALALDENRVDWNCVKFEQTEEGRKKGQILKQCWFSGCHSDIGGGYGVHDLADITLTWMVAQVDDILSFDLSHLLSFPQPVAEWGKQRPHNPRRGMFKFAASAPRDLPSSSANTVEYIHPSVLQQGGSRVKGLVADKPAFMCQLAAFEEELKHKWPYDPKAPQAQRYQKASEDPDIPDQSTGTGKTTTGNHDSLVLKVMDAIGFRRQVFIAPPSPTVGHRRAISQ